MSLDLSQISFKVNTDELKAAIGTMNQVKAAIGSLEQAQAKASTQSSKASKAASDAAKAEAQAALAAIKLEKEKQKAIEASADATVSAGNRSISVLEKQEQVLNFMVQGYSRGQSSILATAKAAGAATDELAKLGSTLQSQRTLMGSDPFDKSLGALRALKNEFSVVKEQVRLYNAELGLTKKQSEDLARDKLRLIEASKIEGKSLFSVRDSVKELNMEYIRLAKSENDLVAQYKQNIKNTQDSAKANTYLETELQKVRFAVDEQNAAMNRGSANALVRFENALRKSGKTAAEQKVLLDEYRKSMEKLQSAGAGRSTDYISRAVGPQLTDIIVGLSTGQSLMTVMMQQGGQLRDQFAMMGVAGAQMGNVMRTALSSMAVSVKDTAVAFGQLFVGGVMDAGKAVLNFANNTLGVNAVLDIGKRRLAAMGEQGFKYIGMLQKVGTAMSALTGAALLTGIAGLVALGVALYQVVKENDKLAVSLALTGGSLGLVHTSAIGYIETLGTMGVTTGTATKALIAMGKAGGFARTDILMVGAAASDMATYAGVAVEDTVKQFAKLREKPVEALIEVAKQTGMVSAETINMVIELDKAGKSADAGALAMKTYADVTKTQIAQMKENYNGFSLFMIDLGKTISNVFSSIFKTMFLATDPTVAMEKQLKNTQELINKYKGAATYNEDGVTGRQVKALELQARMLSSQIGAQTRLNAEKERALEQNTKDATLLEAKNRLFEKSEDSLDKQLKKTQNLAQWQETYINKKKEELAKQSNYNVDQIKFNDKELSQLKELAKVEWDRAQKKGHTSKQENYFATLMRDAENATIKADKATQDFTKSELKLAEVHADPRFMALSKSLRDQYDAKMQLAIADEKSLKEQERVAEGQELINKLLGKAQGLGKDYYDTLEKLSKLRGLPGIDEVEINAALKALQDTTPLAKAMQEWFEKGRKALQGYAAEFTKSNAEIVAQNAEIDYQYSLFGKSEDQQKEITREYQRQVKLQKESVAYEAQKLRIKQDTSLRDDNDRLVALEQLERDHADKVRLINRETAYQYAEDQQRAFDEIRNGISGSIVEALFNGGKAGTRKLRDFLVEQLKKPVTLVVNAIVNTLLGGVMGSLGIGGGGGGSSGDLLGLAGQAGGLWSGLTGTSGILGSIGSALGLNTVAANTALATSIGIDAASAAAAASGASAAGAASGFASALSAIPVWGWIIAAFAAIAAFWEDDSGTLHSGAQALYSASKGLETTMERGKFGIDIGMMWNDQVGKAISGIAMGVVGMLDGIATTFGQAAGYEVATGFADDTSKDGAWGAFRISQNGKDILNWDEIKKQVEDTYASIIDDSLKQQGIQNQPTITAEGTSAGGLAGSGMDVVRANDDAKGRSRWAAREYADGEEGYKQYLAELAKDTRKVMLDMKIPEWAKSVLKDIGDTVSLEQLDEAVKRIITIKGTFTAWGDNMVSFKGLSDDAFGSLMKLAGGFETLSANVNTYYSNFYSQKEQRENLRKQLQKAFDALKLKMPDIDSSSARDQFRALVEAQDLSTEAGRKAYAALIALSGAFAGITDSAASANDAEQARKDAANAAYDALEKAIQAQITVLNAQASSSEALVNKLRGIFDLLKSSVSELYGEVASTSAMQASQGRGVISSAIATGIIPEQSVLAGAIGAVRSEISSTNFTSQFEADKSRLQLAADLSTLLGQTEQQLTTEELTLKGIKDQIAMLELTLTNAKAQLDALNGVNTSVLSVAEAIRAFHEAMVPSASVGIPTKPIPLTNTGGTFSTGTGGNAVPMSNVDEIKQYLINKGAIDPATLNMMRYVKGWTVEEMSKASGIAVSDISTHLGIPAFATGGDYKGGLALVGEEGPEIINFNQGGRVYNATQTSSMLSGGTDTVSAIQSLETRVDNLNYALQAIAVNTSKTARVLERVTPDGDSILITDAATLP